MCICTCREVLKQESKWRHLEARLDAKKNIRRAWIRYRNRCHVYRIRATGAASLKAKREEEEHETYAYRIRIAKRRALEDEEVREFRARRHTDMLRTEQLRFQQIKNSVGSPRTPGGSRMGTLATGAGTGGGPRARRFKEKSNVLPDDLLPDVPSPVLSRNNSSSSSGSGGSGSTSRQILVKGSDAFDDVDMDKDKWVDKTVPRSAPNSVSEQNPLSNPNPQGHITTTSRITTGNSIALPMGSIMESHVEDHPKYQYQYQNSLDTTSCTKSAYPPAFDSSFVSSFSKALTTKNATRRVLRSGLNGLSSLNGCSIDEPGMDVGIASGGGNGLNYINNVTSLCTDVGSRHGCSTVFGAQSYSVADDERIFQLSSDATKVNKHPVGVVEDPLELFKKNIDEKILDLVTGEFQYTDEYYYGASITNNQARLKVEESIKNGSLLMDESKVLEKIGQIKKTLGKQRKTTSRKPGSTNRKSTMLKPNSATRKSTVITPGSAGRKPSSVNKPGSGGRKSTSAHKKSRPSSMKKRREKEIIYNSNMTADELFDKECEPGLELQEEKISLAKKMLQEYT